LTAGCVEDDSSTSGSDDLALFGSRLEEGGTGMASSGNAVEPQPATKRAVLIGGTSAVGSEIARLLATDGYKILFTYNANNCARASLEREFGAALCGTQLDLSCIDSVNAFISQLRDFGAPDAFINSAGWPDDRLCMSLTASALQKMTMINYLAPALISSVAASMMAPRRSGCIVQITSAAARRARVGNAGYGAAKVALERFMASLALEVARFRVKTLCIAPAFVDTPMFAAFAGANRDAIIRNVPMRQILQPCEVANVVSQFVRGTIPTTGNTVVLSNGESVFM
jgi:3-oxoacyl-[acyl-carrier protein] reductase